ncbi:MAG: hypothetical protein ACYCS8_18705 [Acidithiobacillus sp.]
MIFLYLVLAAILLWLAYQHGITTGFERCAERWEGRTKRLTDKHALMADLLEKWKIEVRVKSGKLDRALLEIGKLSEENRRLILAVVKQVEGMK